MCVHHAQLRRSWHIFIEIFLMTFSSHMCWWTPIRRVNSLLEPPLPPFYQSLAGTGWIKTRHTTQKCSHECWVQVDDSLSLFLCWQTVNTPLGCCCLSLLSLPPWLGHSADLCPRQAVRSLPVLLQGVLLSQLQDLASALLNFVRFLLSCASSLSGSLWMSAYLLLCQNCSSNSRVICKLGVITVITCSRLLVMVLNRIHLLVIHPDCGSRLSS